jgi:hypothetical protein
MAKGGGASTFSGPANSCEVDAVPPGSTVPASEVEVEDGEPIISMPSSLGEAPRPNFFDRPDKISYGMKGRRKGLVRQKS